MSAFGSKADISCTTDRGYRIGLLVARGPDAIFHFMLGAIAADLFCGRLSSAARALSDSPI